MKKAVVDLGSNSVLLTVVDGEKILHDEARVVGLGKNLGAGGKLDPKRMAAALAALHDYAERANALGVPPEKVQGIATSASRRASNADAFYGQVAAETGLNFRIITGEEEALASHAGARGGLDLDFESRLFTLDLGGGSTEMVIGDHETVYWWSSVELGSARLTEAFSPDGNPDVPGMKSYIQNALKDVPTHFPCETVIAMAGTATTLGAIDAGLRTWKSEVVHGRCLTRTVLKELVLQLEQATPAERQEIAAVSPERAEFLLAGALIIDGILDRLNVAQCVLSVRGLRFGFLK